MSTVDLIGLEKNYGSVNVLRDINLSIEDGEFIVLVGPSGCGKSTLLRMIAGLEEITAGTLKIGGEVVNGVEARERDIAMVFQSYALYPHMSVSKNIGFPLTVRKVDESSIGTEVSRVAEMTGLSEFLGRKPKALSGGQRQRVAMGRAIIRDPKVFLFDEPLSNLDAKLRLQMRKQIREMHRRLGSTSIYVTHDQVEALTLADRMVLLDAGDIQQIGTPIEIYERPANLFVAGFIGSPVMNFLPGVVTAQGGAMRVELTGVGSIDLPAAVNPGVREGARITLGIRPEHLEIAEGGIAATISDLERLGSETVVFATAGDRSLTCLVRGTQVPTLEDSITLAPDPTQLHFFDGATGQRLP